ncbi:polysaccharide pyruvyl transferase family protein [Enterococcus faecalis]|uniref:polysaccharide pyruvyl transferase family protein n=1 Tax=Enterococcus faecalis TaxID=1351 RepID=UPI0013D3C545|nr:polysaccharide pyruvyl transferase family protein [Enterococcus faecalis]
MKKIGIITLNGDFNYGNRLQNFALQHVLKKEGLYVDTIIIQEEKTDKLSKELLLGNISTVADLYYVIKKIGKKLTIKNTLKRFSYRKMQKKKYVLLSPFSKKYLSSVKVSRSQLNMIEKKYDLFVVGSDQVWNPNIIEFDETHFLNFTSEKKRCSYAASLGIARFPTVPSKLAEHYAKHLNDMRYISVREQAGALLVKNLIKKEVDVAPDPTLLLNKEEWLSKLEIIERESSKDYVLLYFITPISSKVMDSILYFAQMKNMEIIQIMGDQYNETHQIVTPNEFVQLINDAAYFFTDSFHGTVFSIIMETNFLAYERSDGKGIKSRLETLLEKFQLQSLLATEDVNVFEVDKLNDFTNTKKILRNEKNKGLHLISTNILSLLEE